jgi:hypothetical protein
MIRIKIRIRIRKEGGGRRNAAWSDPIKPNPTGSNREGVENRKKEAK